MMIKSCPFCGFDDIGEHTNAMGYRKMECNGCGAGCPLSRDDCYKKWNDRSELNMKIDVNIDVVYDFAKLWAESKGWKTPKNINISQQAWINYWLDMNRYEHDKSIGRPVVPHRT